MATQTYIKSIINHCFAAIMAIAVVLSSSSYAADNPIYSSKNGAIEGADPVAFFSLLPGEKAVLGSDDFTYEWQGATWKFATAENRQKFIDNPEKYAPQYGGYCAFAVSHGFTKDVNPNYWEIVDDKLYLNFNKTAYKKWSSDKAAAITRGNENWPNVRTKCEKHNNCYDKY
ncbi:YHS domain-containing (seleno)protein [Sessilibacter sp. MAH2]